MINFRMLKLSDMQVWFSVGALIIISLLAILSTTYGMQARAGLDPFIYLKRQLVSLLIASGGLVLFLYFDYIHLKKVSIFFYAFMLLILGVVLFSGSSAMGAQRWIMLGPFSFQPSEISKLIMIIVLAGYLSSREKINNFIDAIPLLALAAVPFLLIFKQPDLGTALVFIAILIGMLAAADASPKLLILMVTPFLSVLFRPILALWIVYLLVIVVALFLTRASFTDWLLILGLNVAVGIAVPFMWGMLKSYQRMRIIAFLNPAADPYGAGYHSMQSLIAIGSGGLFGKGFMHGSQTQLQFIPEQHSDFIFSAIGEEWGFFGAAIVVILFAMLVFRALAVAAEARDPFGRLLASGIAVMITFHVLANIGMALGILPVVGIPLPLMSFGGSSLIMLLCSVGILQSIAMRRQKLIF
ncbi:MAG: rod shape-determining protein RodA [Candidatus Margulisbacteria bacterium]|nr:rod shape-determining protein RodA [Candidatus Margulisiibacteriota bacterium]